MRPEFIERVKLEEGFSAQSYWDDAPGGGSGQWTWGYGTKAPTPKNAANPEERITRGDAEVELIAELEDAERDYAAVFQTDPPGITAARRESIVIMLFNLGLSRFSAFTYTIAAIKQGNWERAAAHAQQSLWYRQVGGRARRIVKEFRAGTWVDPVTGEVVVDTGHVAPSPVTAAVGDVAAVVGRWSGLLLRLLGYLRKLRVVRA